MTKLFVSGLVSLMASCTFQVGALAKAPRPTTNAPKEFVQTFYKWYVFSASNEPCVRGMEAVLKERKQSLDADLYKGLLDDEEQQEKNPGEIVGLDFDPFVAANGLIYEQYQTGAPLARGAAYWVPLFGITAGKKTEKPVLTAEVANKNGRWVFTNFHYGKTQFPENENLLSVLSVLRKDRLKPATK